MKGISGEVKSGEMVGIIGSSGAGKSTLLNILSGRVNIGTIKGQILANGQPRDPNNWLKQCNVVEQDDMFYETQTVYEAIRFSANLRLPKQSQESKDKQVKKTIEELGIINVTNSKIGSALRRGISGGERKRTSIGVELVTNPYLLFLDEPTTGLDSFIAYNIIESLQKLAKEQNRAVLMTIHQPRETIVKLFDKIMLLSQGYCVFFGNLSDALNYFEKNGFPCPEDSNPANFFIDLITVDYRSEEKQKASENRINKLVALWEAESKDKSNFKYQEVDKYQVEGKIKSTFESSWLYEFKILFKRSMKEMIFNFSIIGVTLVQSCFQLALLSAVFNGLALNQQGIQNRIGFSFFLGNCF